ncbi:endonuclease I [Pseudomonas oryzihabitans]|uniref:endonuclease I n=1 Tax=Pseudomonas oryzihabitans TaxID=47885 RepID=UPI00147364CA|nr:endonuclease I [Pseudomonas oryzihabitans]NMZ63406.1 endonuclease I [Pseudomonas oryzihabitans]
MAGTRANAFARKATGKVVSAYRSGLEDKIATQLETAGHPVVFEQFKLKYTVPERVASYTPDFILRNNIIIESKGIFDVEDRKKHVLIREQFPQLDIRFVFSSSRAKLYKGSKTTYAEWCEEHGFLFADKLIPAEWLKEKAKPIPEGILIAKGVK